MRLRSFGKGSLREVEKKKKGGGGGKKHTDSRRDTKRVEMAFGPTLNLFAPKFSKVKIKKDKKSFSFFFFPSTNELLCACFFLSCAPRRGSMCVRLVDEIYSQFLPEPKSHLPSARDLGDI